MTGTRAHGRASAIVLNIAAVLGVICLLVAAVSVLTGMRLIIFSTGSMAPTVPAGSLAVTLPVAAADIAVGDVVSAHRAGDGKLVTHRVVAVQHRDGLWLATMRGDANTSTDAAPYDVTSGAQRLLFSVPGVGQAIAQLRSPWILAGVLALLVLIAVPTRSRARRRADAVGVSRGGRAGGGPAPDPGDR